MNKKLAYLVGVALIVISVPQAGVMLNLANQVYGYEPEALGVALLIWLPTFLAGAAIMMTTSDAHR